MENKAQEEFEERKESVSQSSEAVKWLYDHMQPFDGLPILDYEGWAMRISQKEKHDNVKEIIIKADRGDNFDDRTLFRILPVSVPSHKVVNGSRSGTMHQDKTLDEVEVISGKFLMERGDRYGRKGNQYQALSQLFNGFGLNDTASSSSTILDKKDASQFFSHVFAWIASKSANDWFK